MKKNIAIEGVEIGEGCAPYIIAEMSGNHNGDINRAKRLIDEASKAGASAVKLQTYTADSLTIDSNRPEFVLKSGTWKGQNLYHLYQQAHTPLEWFPELFAHAREQNLTIFSSPFDAPGVKLLEELNTPAYKIASNELTDWPLVERVAKTGRPTIMSTGTSTRDEVERTLAFVKEMGLSDLVVLHCVSAYPAPARDANLRTILDISDTFDVLSGFSDHTLGTAASVAAVALGACVIEKHFTLDRNDGGPDSSFSLEPVELKQLCDDCRWAWESLGDIQYGGDTQLTAKSIFKRQFWTTSNIRKGEIFTNSNIRSIRGPSDSGAISTMEYREVLGKISLADIPKHSPLKPEHVNKKAEL
ncbi:pseudaminic acid synthase [Kiloniella majae]|uniref:pseudaminic acid synthase n=1 Tax=Kiloniella majae TaxID=1938558 RepID=UPI000A277D88|nr:pseudaminic acid synthase [Kiloniella majae]